MILRIILKSILIIFLKVKFQLIVDWHLCVVGKLDEAGSNVDVPLKFVHYVADNVSFWQKIPSLQGVKNLL